MHRKRGIEEERKKELLVSSLKKINVVEGAEKESLNDIENCSTKKFLKTFVE